MGREQRNLNFRREENNAVEWAWITKEFCLRLIISSCKNTKGEARLARDSILANSLQSGLLNGTLLGLWGSEGSPTKGRHMRTGTVTALLSQKREGTQARREAPTQVPPILRLGLSMELHLEAGHQLSAGFFLFLSCQGWMGEQGQGVASPRAGQ